MTQEQRNTLINSLMDIVERAGNQNVSNEELAILPEIAKILISLGVEETDNSIEEAQKLMAMVGEKIQILKDERKAWLVKMERIDDLVLQLENRFEDFST